MGKVSLVAKITHVPSLYLSELDGPHKGCRDAAINGHRIISQRCRELGVDTLVVFDTHWLVNSGYHVNCARRWEGIYTSNELPHFIRDMPYACDGNPELGELLADAATKAGVRTRAHQVASLPPEYGTLVPLRYMNPDEHFRAVSVSAYCTVHSLEDSITLGRAMREAVERDYDGNVAFLASGSLSHRFAQNGVADEYLHKMWSPFLETVDKRVIELWEAGEWGTFTAMLAEYAEKCHGEGFMHDTAMMLGVLGAPDYRGKAEVVTPFFPSSGTGQINVIFPV
jgi:3,4-dihydroxyphenylacetate 2,3-dioxygenase